jgi:hypothetical protein
MVTSNIVSLPMSFTIFDGKGTIFTRQKQIFHFSLFTFHFILLPLQAVIIHQYLKSNVKTKEIHPSGE